MMKSKLFSVLGLTVALAAAVGAAPPAAKPAKPADAAAAKIGEKAPAFTLTGIDGKEVSLKDFAGKIVVLEWVNPQCPVCKGRTLTAGFPA
jgi:cytochrome oxidase Cu insertion factor (SCO1/SenC/PrrC family)